MRSSRLELIRYRTKVNRQINESNTTACPNFSPPFSRIRVDLLSYKSKTTDKRTQYYRTGCKNLDGWMTGKYLDGHIIHGWVYVSRKIYNIHTNQLKTLDCKKRQHYGRHISTSQNNFSHPVVLVSFIRRFALL